MRRRHMPAEGLRRRDHRRTGGGPRERPRLQHLCGGLGLTGSLFDESLGAGANQQVEPAPARPSQPTYWWLHWPALCRAVVTGRVLIGALGDTSCGPGPIPLDRIQPPLLARAPRPLRPPCWRLLGGAAHTCSGIPQLFPFIAGTTSLKCCANACWCVQGGGTCAHADGRHDLPRPRLPTLLALLPVPFAWGARTPTGELVLGGMGRLVP